LDSAPTQLSVSSKDHVLVLNELGTINLWSSAAAPTTTNPTPTKKARIAAVITRPAESTISFKVLESEDLEARALPVLAAAFVDDRIAVAFGNTVRPTFERISFLDASGSLVKSCEHVREDSGAGVLSQKGTLAEQDLVSYKSL
jgi:hypothetical protein